LGKMEWWGEGVMHFYGPLQLSRAELSMLLRRKNLAKEEKIGLSKPIKYKKNGHKEKFRE